MAGLTGHRALTDGLFQHFMAAERTIKADVQQAAKEAGTAGHQKALWKIAHTKSDLASYPKDNRNYTWEMSNSLAVEVESSGDNTSIRMGWLKTKEQYFLIQEDGGVVDGKTVRPMNALMAGHDEMLKTLSRWGLKIT